MQQFLYWMGDHWAQTAVLLSLVIQISPIKCNPWTALLGWIGRIITRDVMQEVEGIKAGLADVRRQQKQQQLEQDKNEMDRIRSEVLDFANSCRNKRRHTKEEFDHIFDLNDKYKALLEKNGQQNGRFEEAFAYVCTLYRKCMDENDFL